MRGGGSWLPFLGVALVIIGIVYATPIVAKFLADAIRRFLSHHNHQTKI